MHHTQDTSLITRPVGACHPGGLRIPRKVKCNMLEHIDNNMEVGEAYYSEFQHLCVFCVTFLYI